MATATVLTAFLNADITKFEKGMRKAGGQIKGFGKAVSLGTKAAGAAIVGVSAALGVLGVKQMAVIDETAKLSKALGVNTREYQALALAASEAGITQDQLGNMITKSQRSIVEASRGLATYKRSFDTLGLSVEDLMQKTPDEQFSTIAQALSELENPTLRTATALEIFGRSGRQVINMLDGYIENVDNARAFNDKWGVSLTAIDASKVEEANDKFARVGQAVDGLGNIMAVKMAPMITHISELFLQSGLDGQTFGKWVQNGVAVAGGALDIFRKAWIGLKGVIAGVVFTTLDLLEKLMGGLYSLGESIANVLNMIPGVAIQANESLLTMRDSIGRVRDAAGTTLQDIIKDAREFETTQERIEKIQMRADARAKVGASDTTQPLLKTIDLMEKKEKQSKKNKKATEQENEVARDLGLTMSSSFEKAIEGGEKFSDVLQGLFDDIQKILTRRLITEPLGDFVTGTIEGFGSSGGLSSGGGFIDGIGSFVSDIFGGITPFATGTNYVPQDMIAQIHKGEMIVPAYDANKIRGGGMGGGAVNVIINNNANANVSTSSKETGDGTQLNVMIDQAVADNINKSGTRTNTAIKGMQNRTRITR